MEILYSESGLPSLSQRRTLLSLWSFVRLHQFSSFKINIPQVLQSNFSSHPRLPCPRSVRMHSLLSRFSLLDLNDLPFHTHSFTPWLIPILLIFSSNYQACPASLWLSYMLFSLLVKASFLPISILSNFWRFSKFSLTSMLPQYYSPFSSWNPRVAISPFPVKSLCLCWVPSHAGITGSQSLVQNSENQKFYFPRSVCVSVYMFLFICILHNSYPRWTHWVWTCLVLWVKETCLKGHHRLPLRRRRCWGCLM